MCFFLIPESFQILASFFQDVFDDLSMEWNVDHNRLVVRVVLVADHECHGAEFDVFVHSSSERPIVHSFGHVNVEILLECVMDKVAIIQMCTEPESDISIWTREIDSFGILPIEVDDSECVVTLFWRWMV